MNYNSQNKIEIVNCPNDCRNCVRILLDINRLFHDSEQYQLNNEYPFSVASLKKAFEKTYELSEPLEQQCGNFFRHTIIESLKVIHQELGRMIKGFFLRGRYTSSYIMTEDTLKEYKKIQTDIDEGKIQNFFIPSKDLELTQPVV